jgi:hypothetical protein
MSKFTAKLLALAAFLWGSHAFAYDLDSSDPGNGFSLFLGAGVYQVRYDAGAWNAWGGDTNCPGTPCHGWLNSFNIISLDAAVDFDVGAPFDGTWSTPAQAESLGRLASPFFFTLAHPQSVKFYMDDSNYTDNVGSISISVGLSPSPRPGQ